ncbi:hypothetical protein [Algibacter aquimarinus]|uniref:NlpE C-terminal OB domain-containing protein n=1 Tax=Algibacter aquimarinus TaxID=1136748 RepID=A0ABP9HJN2_9FLAO
MKRIVFIVLIFTAFISCKNDSKSENKEIDASTESNERTAKQSDGLTLLKGEFVYHDGAAVLQTHAQIYGVLITDKMLELDKMADAYKKEPTDMVSVEVRGKITNQKDEKILWENKLEIVEILNVKRPKEEDNTIKIGQ